MYKRYIGDRAFYSHMLKLAVPMIIQNGITNFVSLLDNIMVGQVGTLEMSGVSIANMLIFIFNLCIFGASAGAGIFVAQFHGRNDDQGIRYAHRYKLLICLVISVLAMILLGLFDDPLITMYLQGGGDPAEAALALSYGKDYLHIMLLGLIPFALSNIYCGTLRESDQTTVPMIAGICAVLTNLVLNYILIFGHFGAPQLGIRGAAIATVVSRFVELAVVSLWTHRHADAHPFADGVYRSLVIPKALFVTITKKSLPLLFNEFLWSSGVALINQCYSTCSLDVVPALNIATTMTNLGSVVYMAIGQSVGIIMGQMLGAGKPKHEIMDTNRKLLAASVAAGALFGVLMIGLSWAFPMLYNTTGPVRQLAALLICITAACMPFHAYTHATYFTLRSGGQTFITFLFDSCCLWIIRLPLAILFSYLVKLPIIPLYILCNVTDSVRCILAVYILKKGNWIKNLTE